MGGSIGLGFAEAAEILGVTRQSVYLAVRTLGIACVREGGRSLQIPLGEFARLVVTGGFLGRQPKHPKAITRREAKQAVLKRAMDLVLPQLEEALDEGGEVRLNALREVGETLRRVREAA